MLFEINSPYPYGLVVEDMDEQRHHHGQGCPVQLELKMRQ